MTDEAADAAPSHGTLRRFTWGLATMTAAVFGLVLPWIRHHEVPWWPWAFAAIVLVWGLLAPASVAPFHRLASRAARVIGEFNNRLLLTVVFVCCFMPVGLARRILRRDPLARGFDAAATTYRIKRDPGSSSRLDRPY